MSCGGFSLPAGGLARFSGPAAGSPGVASRPWGGGSVARGAVAQHLGHRFAGEGENDPHPRSPLPPALPARPGEGRPHPDGPGGSAGVPGGSFWRSESVCGLEGAGGRGEGMSLQLGRCRHCGDLFPDQRGQADRQCTACGYSGLRVAAPDFTDRSRCALGGMVRRPGPPQNLDLDLEAADGVPGASGALSCRGLRGSLCPGLSAGSAGFQPAVLRCDSRSTLRPDAPEPPLPFPFHRPRAPSSPSRTARPSPLESWRGDRSPPSFPKEPGSLPWQNRTGRCTSG